MRLLELFITETTEEDRAIISLSSVIFSYLKKYSGKQLSAGETINLGKIGDLFNTPINILDPVNLYLWNNADILKQFPEENSKEDSDEGDEEDNRTILGFWDPMSESIIFNADYLESNGLKSAVTHELRHALDDYKSDFRASTSKRYSTPKKKEHRKDYSKDDYAPPLLKSQSYRAKPEEINARFAEVLHGLTSQVEHALKKYPTETARKKVRALFNTLMVNKRISDLFPEKEKSRDYKRLVKRAMDFIDKEINYKSNTPEIKKAKLTQR